MADPRTPELIQADYARLAMRAGDLSYRIHAMTRDLAECHAEMLTLNHELAAIPVAKKEP